MTATLKQFETFVWVAALGSFRRTAEKLNTTQPNISVRISGLEASLGVKLFDRDAGSVTLTAAGTHLLEPAQRVLDASDAFAAQAGTAARQSGVIRLGVTEIIVQSWLGRFLKELRALYPETVVELVVDLSAELEKDLTDRALDLALMNGPVPDPAIHSVALGDVPLMWVAAPEIAKTVTGLDAVSRHPVLTFSRKTVPYAELAAYFRDHPAGPVRLVPSNNLAACVQMTVDGLGIAALPHILIKDALAEGRLVPLDIDWCPAPLHFTACYAHTPSRSVVRKAAELAQTIAREDMR